MNHEFSTKTVDLGFLDQDKTVYFDDLQSYCRPGLVTSRLDRGSRQGHGSWHTEVTKNTCADSKVRYGTPSSTKRTSNSRRWCPIWCWNKYLG